MVTPRGLAVSDPSASTKVLTKHKLYVTTYAPLTEGFSAQPIAGKRSVALARKAVSE